LAQIGSNEAIFEARGHSDGHTEIGICGWRRYPELTRALMAPTVAVSDPPGREMLMKAKAAVLALWLSVPAQAQNTPPATHAKERMTFEFTFYRSPMILTPNRPGGVPCPRADGGRSVYSRPAASRWYAAGRSPQFEARALAGGTPWPARRKPAPAPSRRSRTR